MRGRERIVAEKDPGRAAGSPLSLRFHLFCPADEVLKFQEFAGAPAGAPAARFAMKPHALLFDVVEVVHTVSVIPGEDVAILLDE